MLLLRFSVSSNEQTYLDHLFCISLNWSGGWSLANHWSLCLAFIDFFQQTLLFGAHQRSFQMSVSSLNRLIGSFDSSKSLPRRLLNKENWSQSQMETLDYRNNELVAWNSKINLLVSCPTWFHQIFYHLLKLLNAYLCLVKHVHRRNSSS